jgi:hypothetical protein
MARPDDLVIEPAVRNPASVPRRRTRYAHNAPPIGPMAGSTPTECRKQLPLMFWIVASMQEPRVVDPTMPNGLD